MTNKYFLHNYLPLQLFDLLDNSIVNSKSLLSIGKFLILDPINISHHARTCGIVFLFKRLYIFVAFSSVHWRAIIVHIYLCNTTEKKDTFFKPDLQEPPTSIGGTEQSLSDRYCEMPK